MKHKNNWLKKYPMIDYQEADCSKIKNSVRKKLSEQKDEVIYMKTRKFKSFAIILAVVGISAASFFTVNAATDGAVVDTVKDWIGEVTIFIDGKEVEVAPSNIKKGTVNGEDYLEYEFEINDGNSDDDEHNVQVFEFREEKDSVTYSTEDNEKAVISEPGKEEYSITSPTEVDQKNK